MNKSQIETRVYDNTIKSYTAKLADVEGKLTVLEAEEALKRGEFLRRLFRRNEKPWPELRVKKTKKELKDGPKKN